MAERWGNSGNSGWLCFSGLQNHCRWWSQPWNKKMLTPWKENYDQPRQHIKKKRHYFANKGPSSQGYGFSSSHVWMWELDCEKSWEPKNWCFWTVVLENTLESPLDCKEIQPVHPRGDRSVLGVHWKDWCWSRNSNTLATWCEELTHLKRPWCWERLRAEGEGDDRGWDGLMASLTGWTWVWVDSGSWWWIGRPGMPCFMGSQSLKRLSNWTELMSGGTSNKQRDWWWSPYLLTSDWVKGSVIPPSWDTAACHNLSKLPACIPGTVVEQVTENWTCMEVCLFIILSKVHGISLAGFRGKKAEENL